MHCPECDGPGSHITRTRTLYDRVSRLRKCDSCGHQWMTAETGAGMPRPAPKPALRRAQSDAPKDARTILPPVPVVPDCAVVGTIEELLRRYESKTLPTIKNAATHTAYVGAIKVLRLHFGARRYARFDSEALEPGVLRPPEMNQYLVDNGNRSNAAKKEISLLGRVFRLAKTHWGLTTFNPVEGVEYPSRPPRDAYISDAMFLKMREAAGPLLRCTMDIASQTGARRGMIFDIRIGDIEPDHLVVRVSKKKTRTGFDEVHYVMTPDLRGVLDEALTIRRSNPGGSNLKPADFLFVTRNGFPYFGENFKRIWKTMRDRLGFDAWSFTFHDLRAKAASDSTSDEAAQRLLVHADARITRRVYRRKAIVVQPLTAVTADGRTPTKAT